MGQQSNRTLSPGFQSEERKEKAKYKRLIRKTDERGVIFFLRIRRTDFLPSSVRFYIFDNFLIEITPSDSAWYDGVIRSYFFFQDGSASPKP